MTYVLCLVGWSRSVLLWLIIFNPHCFCSSIHPSIYSSNLSIFVLSGGFSFLAFCQRSDGSHICCSQPEQVANCWRRKQSKHLLTVMHVVQSSIWSHYPSIHSFIPPSIHSSLHYSIQRNWFLIAVCRHMLFYPKSQMVEYWMRGPIINSIILLPMAYIPCPMYNSCLYTSVDQCRSTVPLKNHCLVLLGKCCV